MMIQGEGFLPPTKDIERAGLPFVMSQYRADAIEHLFAEILDGRTVKDICEDMLMPPYNMVRRWLATNAAFRSQYIEVCKAALLPEVMECIHIADNTSLNAADRGRAKLRIETRLKFGERLLPEVFGRPSVQGNKKPPPPTDDPLGKMLQDAGNIGHSLPKAVDAEIVEE